MTARWLFVPCALSGALIVACGADASDPPRGGAGSTPAGVTTGTGSAATTGAGSTTGSGGSSEGTGTGGQGGSPYFPVVGSGGTASTGSGPGGGAAQGAGGGGGGSAAGTCSGASLCDSFERPMLGPDWVLDNNTASTVIEMVTNKAHTGTNSVHISVGTSATQSYVSESKTFPAMGNAFWGRAWIFSTMPLSGHQIYIEARVAAGSDKTGVRSANTFDTKGNLGLNLESSDASKNSTIPMPIGTWACYEWQITGIGGMGTFSSWVDGKMIGTQNGAIPKLGRQRIGIQRYAAGTAGEMWIDDVAIGDQRINCTP